MAASACFRSLASQRRVNFLSSSFCRQQFRSISKDNRTVHNKEAVKAGNENVSCAKSGKWSRFLTGSLRNNTDLPRIVAPVLSRWFSTDSENGDRRKLKLMDFPEIIWPSPMKSFRNMLFGWLIKGYYDTSFSKDSFVKGAEQAVRYVSEMIGAGRFEELEGLVDNQALREIEYSYNQLSVKQRQFLSVDPKDFFFKFLYEIGMIFDDATNERFVEITVVFQGYHGYNDAKALDPVKYYQEIQTNQDSLYVCNYRFIRDFTKGKEDDWTINKLNHFNPKELVRDTPPFSR